MASRRQHEPGFTLIEVLVAVAISMVVATLAYGFLSSAATAKQSTDEALLTVNSLETVFQLLSTDLHHLVDRNLPSAAAGIGSAGPAPAFMGGDSSRRTANFLLGDYVLRFARDGWANPLQQQRSDLQRVGYRWLEGELWRDYWPERNQALDTEPAGQRLLISNLEAVRVRFLPANATQVVDNTWQDVWPAEDSSAQGDGGSLPVAVEITLTLEDLGDVQRIFSLPGV
ncbi:MAG: type II secretion system minor pseudopilin GspJ [Cellvibrionaceae bacterium]